MRYIKAQSVDEAVQAFAESENGIYYSGGTEIVTMRRMGKIHPEALIDLKGIPEYIALESLDDRWIIGGGVDLNRIAEDVEIPLLSQVCSEVADHTVRNVLTLAGNICGRLPYREALIPLLLLEAQVLLAGAEGTRLVSLESIFDRRLKLMPGEWIVQFEIQKGKRDFHSIRRTRGTAVDYPIVHTMGMRSDKGLHIGCAGLLGYPFVYSGEAFQPPGPIRADQRASAEYREHLARLDFMAVKEVLV